MSDKLLNRNFIEEMEDNDRYYIFVDDFLISTQYTLIYSLVNFYHSLVVTKKSLTDYLVSGNDSDITIPNDSKDITSMVKSYLVGEEDKFNNLMDKTGEKLDEVFKELGVSKIEELTPKIMHRKKKIMLSLEGILNVHPDIEIEMKTMSTGLCHALIPMKEHFEKTHRIILRNDFERELFLNTIYDNNLIEHTLDEFPLDIIDFDDVKNDIIEDYKNDKIIYLMSSDIDFVEDVFAESEGIEDSDGVMFVLKPSICNFLNYSDIPDRFISTTNIWG